MANISLACVLLVVGYFFYKEVITLKQLVDMGVCALGLMLIVKYKLKLPLARELVSFSDEVFYLKKIAL